MLIVETIAKIRRYYFVDGKGIREISRMLKVSRNTVRKVIRSNATEHHYVRTHQPMPRLGAWISRLEALLEADSKRPRKRRITARRLYELLQGEGYDGSYDSVQRFCRKWRDQHGQRSSGVYVPLSFAPGDAYQFDWSHELVVIKGVPQEVKVAHFRLSHSCQPFVVAYPRESSEMVYDAHDRAFAFFGGTCKRGIYDNMTTAVTKVLQGKERVFNRGFLQLCSHYLVEPVACTPGAGWEKGQVERQVKNIREWLFTPRPRFDSLEELNDWLAGQCIALAARRKHPTYRDRTIREVFEEEQAELIPVTAPFNGYAEREVRISSTCLAGYDRNQYSVDCRAAGKTATLRATATRITVLYEGEVIADHCRRFGRGKTVYDPWHYIGVLERKPGALRDGAPFKDWQLPSSLLTIQQKLLKRPGGDREFVEILNAVLTHGMEATEQACQSALNQGMVRSEVVLNLIMREQDPLPLEPVNVPESLALSEEPVADCGRYDALIPEVCHAAS